MSALPENIHQILMKLIPASVINEITCIVFYDRHPMDDKNIDIIVCTKMGEVREYYHRNLVSSIKLDGISKPSEIKLLRNSRCDLFYLVVAKDVIMILSRNYKIHIHQVIVDVERYDFNDTSCSGQAYLRVFRKSDAVPLLFDDNFEVLERQDISMVTHRVDEAPKPVVTNLKRKLTEAKYSLKCNEKTHDEFLNLHQAAAFNMYKKVHPNLDDSIFTDGPKQMANALKINVQSPWIRVCNEKIVIVFNVTNLNYEILEDVHILLHSTTGQSIEYTTKLFERTHISPYWQESRTQTLINNVEMAIVVVIDIDELKHNIASPIQISGVIFYKRMGKDCLLPIEDITFASMATVAEEFDAFAHDLTDPYIILAILATAKRADLAVRHLKRPSDDVITLDTFCKYLKMEKVPYCENVAIHKRTPYLTFYGVMLVINHGVYNDANKMSLSIYAKSSTQVLSLILYIKDAVPYYLVITTPNYKITAKYEDVSLYNEEIVGNTQLLYDYQHYSSSMLNRTDYVLKYLDNCIVKMHNSGDPQIQSKIGNEIDVFSDGEASYLDFKEKMRREAAEGVNMEGVKYSPRSYDDMLID